MIIFDNSERVHESREQTELIEQLLDIGAALSSTRDLTELLHLILSKSREITCSDAGSVYLVDTSDEIPRLLFKVAQNDSLPHLSFREFAIPLTQTSLAGYVALTGESLNLSDAYDLPPGVPYQLNRNFDRDISYTTRSVMVLPMQNRQGETIGVLQLINRKIGPDVALDNENTWELTQPYSQWEERIIRSLASQAAISIERQQLQNSIENLFEGFVKASVQVIEARDPCTSGHSERVAALTVRLTEAVNQVNSGPLGGIHFNRQQIKEIRYAALLHDVGKIGVPEAILQKQKKLYAEQLEVIRNRFGFVQRTLEMECAQAKYQLLLNHGQILHSSEVSECPHCQTMELLEQELESKISKLNHYWQVLLTANEPRILAEEPLSQLQELSNYTYQDLDGTEKPLLTRDEMMQLIVPRGNLTAEERLSIEAHVSHSYEFLRRIPWTKGLAEVPEIAYGHHERLDGSGYPRGVTSREIPLQAQIMVIADIYDALTAGDRPYKRGLPTQAALKILRQEAAQKKINGDFLALFEEQEIYRVINHQL